MKRIMLAIILLCISAVALAQAFDVPAFNFDMLTELGKNPLFMASAVVGIVTAIRKSQPWLDGPVLVPAFGALVGAVLGALVQLASMLTVEPFAAMNFPWGGLAYGALCALSGTVGLNLIDYVASLFRPKTDPVATTLALVATGQSPNAGAWIVETVKGLVPRNKVTKALEELAPVIRQFAGSLLTDELRAELQTKIHTTLRKAGLLKGRDLA